MPPTNIFSDDDSQDQVLPSAEKSNLLLAGSREKARTRPRIGPYIIGSLRHWCLIAVFVILSGCATIDFDYPKMATTAFEQTDDTHLGRVFAGQADAHPGQSGFYPLIDGVDALAVRLLMAKRAERSIDAQYYLITDDIVGHLFIGSLLQAADRGVRVRLLLDDIETKGYDAGMAALDSHPNFEVRIFNPFAWRSARLLGGAISFTRINRRMHNKSFTTDNQVTVVGGRNIADEYFGARQDVIFGDLDVLSVGPVVGDVSRMFDTYWNNRAAVPVPVFADLPEDADAALKQLRERIAQSRKQVDSTRYAAAVRSSVLDIVESDASVFTWAPYQLVYDSPDKAQRDKAEEAASILTPLRQSVLGAEKELLVVSPYFVLRKTGIEGFRGVRSRGIDVSVVTNSLAATNQSLVHGGYAPVRKPLLKMGVKLYEVRADASVSGADRVGAESARATLHTKAFIVDRRQLFIGSFNWDPRSAYINTELGVIIDSPELSQGLAERLDKALPEQTYEVFLTEQGKIRWRGLENGKVVVLNKEPETGFWRRFKAGFMRILPIRGQL